MARKYTEHEMNFILSNYKTKSNDEIGKELSLSRNAIRKKLKRLGIHRTYEEIKQNYDNNKYKVAHYGEDHPMFGKERTHEVKEKISKKLKFRTEPYKRKEIYVNGKKIREHIFVWCSQSENLPYVPKGFVIHHIDCNVKNNSPDNLLLMSASDHGKLHSEISNMIRSQQ
jgi:hypothetical protein